MWRDQGTGHSEGATYRCGRPPDRATTVVMRSGDRPQRRVRRPAIVKYNGVKIVWGRKASSLDIRGSGGGHPI
jgi:hypothetical protein